uniref:Putative c3h1-type zn-finger protein n=1 Tax=Triatoma dimidiata TaxID=72491 RepID=A0A0V0G6T6_TRIDM
MVNEEDKERKPICRDFLRNACARGDSCKYTHPEEKYVFCHDYQNGRCSRRECVFLHCSRDDEEHYTQYGELPPHLLASVPSYEQLSENPIPICKDFLKGDCDRINCKFRHLMLVRDHYEFEPIQKRRRYEPLQHFVGQQLLTLEDENALLHKTVGELKKRVDDLQATNEFLLEQNAQMRLNDKAAASGLAAVTVPAAVTITNGQIQNQVSAAIRTVTASVATVPVSIAAVAAGTPVSIATVSMSPVIPAPSVSVAQQQHDPHNANSTAAPMVSYPLVARPVMPNL